MEPTRLAAIPLFATLAPADLERLAGVAGELEVAEGTPLTEEGDFGHALFAIESGTADVATDGTVIRSVGPGEVVGEVAVLASGRRTANFILMKYSSPIRRAPSARPFPARLRLN